jgi:hypothetical protein
MSKSEVAVVEPSVGTVAPIVPPLQSMFEAVEVSDIQLSRIYLQAPLSKAVANGIAKPGQATLSAGSDDANPVILIEDPKEDSFIVYIIGREKFAATTSGGGLTFHPDKKRDPSDPESWEGWFFDVALPDVDPALPARWMLWKTSGRPVANAINTILERKFQAGDYSPACLKVSVVERNSGKGHKYHAFQIVPTSPTAEGLEIATGLAAVAQDLRSKRGVENDAPTVDQPSFS